MLTDINNHANDDKNTFTNKLEVEKLQLSSVECAEVSCFYETFKTIFQNLTMDLENELGNNVFKAFDIVR